MTEKSKRRYAISALNGMEIEVIGAKQLPKVAELFSSYKLRFREIKPNKRIVSNLGNQK